MMKESFMRSKKRNTKPTDFDEIYINIAKSLDKYNKENPPPVAVVGVTHPKDHFRELIKAYEQLADQFKTQQGQIVKIAKFIKKDSARITTELREKFNDMDEMVDDTERFSVGLKQQLNLIEEDIAAMKRAPQADFEPDSLSPTNEFDGLEDLSTIDLGEFPPEDEQSDIWAGR